MLRHVTLIVSCLCLVTMVNAADPSPEFRAGWVTRFDWPDANPEKCKANITQVMDAAVAGNLNAVVFQIRGEAETLYPSQIEPWSSLIGGKDPGFDPAALAISEAHKRGLQLHAYINAMPLRSTRDRNPPADPKHLWHSHGPGSPEPWVCVDEQGQPTREEYTYLSAAIPEVHAYLRKVIMDVVNRYDVDGIHLDRVRYPDPQYIHDAISEARFHSRGNPNLLDRNDWQREQLDKFINDLAAEIHASKPKCVLSCSAWGIYNRHNIEGYGGFSSGYHDYYQDTWNWCRLGAMDYLCPMIYWNIPDPKPNYDEVLKDFVSGVGPEHVVGGQRLFSPEENAAQVQVGRDIKAAGAVFFTLGRGDRRGVFSKLKETLYTTPVPVPPIARIAEPKSGDILGRVLAGDGTPLADAWVSLVGPEQDRRDRGSHRSVFAQTWTSGSDGRFAFHNVPPGPVKLRVQYIGAAAVESAPVQVDVGQVASIDVKVPDGELARNKAFMQILSPSQSRETTAEVVHVLGRTTPESKVRVGDKDAEVFATGAFVRDGVALAVGENKIPITVTNKAGQTCTEELIVRRNAAAPTESQPAQQAQSQPAGEPPIEPMQAVGEAKEDGVGITYGLHSVRLGGPWLGRVPQGTRFAIVGKRDGNYKVALSPSMSGWVSERQVTILPEKTPVPHNYFTACEISGDDKYDCVSVGLREKIVFAVRSETDPSNRIYVDFFNTHDALTWISHKSGAKIVGPVTGEQIEENHFRLTLPIKSKQIWGYWTEIQGNMLKIYVRRPPTIAESPNSPLKGLLVALEAGHGGSGSGAVGLMGTKEKDINAAAVQALKDVLEQRGTKTILVRPRDSSPSLQERADRANEAGADFFVSIHGNAAGNSRGYLAISGTSTYYKDKHCWLPADLVYRKLLALGWNEFGVVGNFSYHPLTNTRVPGILVEQAFMSNPSDEARLLDPVYQRQQAEAIAAGLEEFFAAVRE